MGVLEQNKYLIAAVSAVVVATALAFYYIFSLHSLSYLLNPPDDLTLYSVLLIAFILGIFHGVTPDEHTWPITFSYAVGSYSTRKGMKAGFAFSLGFTLQRAFLTTIGFLGLAAIYTRYNLDGPVYVLVGIAMAVVGMYVLNKKALLHIPFDALFRSEHHTSSPERMPMHDVNPNVAVVHGLIAGFGFGAYSTIIVFILAPQVPSLIYAPLVGLMFGLGTMVMQIIFGAAFANLARLKRLSESQMKHVGGKTAGRTLLYGGIAFAVIGALVIAFPAIDSFAIATGNPIPNLSSIGVATILVLVVVGVIGIGSLMLGIREMLRMGSVTTNAKAG
jgi:ABC-type nickel/cobalt efflux system permease component RcnA